MAIPYNLRVQGVDLVFPVPQPSGGPTKIESGTAFFSPGVGAGHDYVDVVFSSSFPNTSYIFTLAVGMNNDVDGAPDVHRTLPTIDGFRIRADAAFSGVVSWSASE